MRNKMKKRYIKCKRCEKNKKNKKMQINANKCTKSNETTFVTNES
jgi:hypothetical protein